MLCTLLIWSLIVYQRFVARCFQAIRLNHSGVTPNRATNEVYSEVVPVLWSHPGSLNDR